jgi:hypothetical protein
MTHFIQSDFSLSLSSFFSRDSIFRVTAYYFTFLADTSFISALAFLTFLHSLPPCTTINEPSFDGLQVGIPTGVRIQFWILGYAWLWFKYPDPTLLSEAEQSGVSIATRSDQPGICICIWSWWDVHLMLELFSVCLSVSLLFSLSFSYILHAFVHIALGNELCFANLAQHSNYV